MLSSYIVGLLGVERLQASKLILCMQRIMWIIFFIHSDLALHILKISLWFILLTTPD